MAFIDCNFHSDTLGLAVSLYAIVPQAPARRAARARRYRTLLLLHGLSDDHTIWMRRTAIERYAAEKDLAVIMPAAGRSFYQDMASGPKYWTFISEELPRVTRALFPLSAAREDNFVAGLSMGGYGAFRLALSRPGAFAAAASLSGALDLARYCQSMGGASPETRVEAAAIFGRKPRIGGSPADLLHLARQVGRGAQRPRLYQYCGRRDFLHADNLRFRDAALRAGLDVTYVEDGGDHQWACWDEQIRRVIAWLPR